MYGKFDKMSHLESIFYVGDAHSLKHNHSEILSLAEDSQV